MNCTLSWLPSILCLVVALSCPLPVIADIAEELEKNLKQERRAIELELDRQLRQETKEVMACNSKLLEWFPTARFEPSELLLDQIAMRGTMVVIQLKTPRGAIKTVFQQSKTVESALQFIGLLQSRKIGAVSVRPYAVDLGRALAAELISTEDIKACDKNWMADKLSLCHDCEITEWIGIRP